MTTPEPKKPRSRARIKRVPRAKRAQRAELVGYTTINGWIPTRKWLAATLTAGVGLGVMLLTGDSTITDPEWVAIGTFIVQRGVAYILGNEDTPGGAPDAARVPQTAVVESGSSHVRGS